MSGKTRVQFDFTEEALREADQLQKDAGFSSRAELIRHALRLLQWLMNEIRKEKATLYIEKDGKMREIVFPFWRMIK